MNKIEEIREDVQKFVEEKKQIEQQISEIETQRTQLAQERNNKKNAINRENSVEIKELGQKISELGNQSQNLQKQLDIRKIEIKAQMNLILDNSVAEDIRRVRKINEQVQELEQSNKNFEERNIKYTIQKQEFYVRFGRMPELSNAAKKENKLQQQKYENNMEEISILKNTLKEAEKEILDLTIAKKELKQGNFAYFKKEQEPKIQEIKEKEIITLEDEKIEQSETINTLGKPELIDIIIKVENGKVIYKAQISDGKTITINTVKNRVLVEENRKKIKDILINYAIKEYKNIDKKVLSRIDPVICLILQEFANKYNENEQKLIYDYAMSFSKIEKYHEGALPNITYNLSYINEAQLSSKERKTINKICKNASQNRQIDVIGGTIKLTKIKYILIKIFNIKQVDRLPEGKY